MTPISRSTLHQFIIIHVACALILNLPALVGKVPLPVSIINTFPPWQGLPAASVEPVPDRGLGDLVTQIYPWRVLAAESLARGQLPLWNPHILGGTPFIANSQSAVFYPLNWLYIVLPAAVAWTVLFIVRTALAGIFASLLARSLGASPLAAMAGGIVFAGCGFMTVWRGYPMGDAAIWLPLACFAVLRLSQQQTAMSMILAAITFAMPVLAGHPETAAHIALAAGALGVYQWFRLRSSRQSRGPYVAFFVCAVAFAVGLAAVQILPTLEWLGQTTMTLESRWPPRPLGQIVALISRDLFSQPNNVGVPLPEGAGYAGFVTLVLAGFAWTVRRFRSTTAFFTAMAVVALGIVYGIEPFHWLSRIIPVVSGLKNGRLLLVVDFSLAMLAAIGLSSLMELRTRRRTIVAGTCALLLAVDMLTYSYGFVPFVSAATIYPPSPVYDFLRANTNPSERVAYADSAVPTNLDMIYGLRALSGYEVALKAIEHLFRDYADGDPGGISLTTQRIEHLADRRLDMMAVKYLVVSAANEGPERLAKRPERFRLAYSFGSARVFENLYVSRCLWLIPFSNVEVASSDAKQYERVRSLDFDPSAAAVVSHLPDGYTSGVQGAGSPEVNEIAFPTPARIQATATATEPSVLVLSETRYPGWTVTVDGRRQPILQANYALMAVALPAGKHQVLFEFRGMSVKAGLGASTFAILLCIAIWQKGRKKPLSGKTIGTFAGLVLLSVVIAEAAIIQSREEPPPPRLLELSRTRVIAGRESYVLKIQSLSGQRVSIRYSFDGGTPAELSLPLDARGEVEIEVPVSTRKGVYHLTAFRKENTSAWTEVDTRITVE